jgi:hypothetical protein
MKISMGCYVAATVVGLCAGFCWWRSARQVPPPLNLPEVTGGFFTINTADQLGHLRAQAVWNRRAAGFAALAAVLQAAGVVFDLQ